MQGDCTGSTRNMCTSSPNKYFSPQRYAGWSAAHAARDIHKQRVLRIHNYAGSRKLCF